MQVPVYDILSPAPFSFGLDVYVCASSTRAAYTHSLLKNHRQLCVPWRSHVDDANLWSHDVSDLTSMRVITTGLCETAMWADGGGSVRGKTLI